MVAAAGRPSLAWRMTAEGKSGKGGVQSLLSVSDDVGADVFRKTQHARRGAAPTRGAHPKSSRASRTIAAAGKPTYATPTRRRKKRGRCRQGRSGSTNVDPAGD